MRLLRDISTLLCPALASVVALGVAPPASPAAEASSASITVAVHAPPSARIGQYTTVTVTVANPSTSPAIDTVVTIPDPPDATLYETEPGAQSCVPGSMTSATVVCNVGTLAPGQAIALPLRYIPTFAGSLDFRASVSAAQGGATVHDGARAVTTVPQQPVMLPRPPTAGATRRRADLGASIVRLRLSSGKPDDFELRVTNRSRTSDPGVVVSAAVPSHARVVGLPPGCTVRAATILCVAGTVRPLNRATHQIYSAEFEVLLTPAGPGPVSLTETVTGALPDRVPGNDSTTAQATVAGRPSAPVDVGVALALPPHPVIHGRPATLTATVTDHSTRRATGVVLALPFPSGSAPVSTPHGCRRDGTTVLCAIGTLASHHTAQYRLRVRWRAAGLEGVTAAVRGSQTDPITGNDHAAATVRVSP